MCSLVVLCGLLVEIDYFCGSCLFFFKQKTAYEMRISDWSSDVCSSDLSLLSVFGATLAGCGSGSDDDDDDASGGNDGGTDPSGAAYSVNFTPLADNQIGRASCRERVCQYV